MLCNVNRCLFPFSVQNNAFPRGALSAYTTSAPASEGGAAGGACVGRVVGGVCCCFLTRLEASGVGSMTAGLGPVQRARCRRLDHGKHVLCCGEWTRAAGRWLPCWEAASLLSCAAGVGKGRHRFLSVWGRTALLFILPTFSTLELDFSAVQGHTCPVFICSLFNVMRPPPQTTHVHHKASVALCLQPPVDGILNFHQRLKFFWSPNGDTTG